MTDLADFSAVELITAYRSKEISPVETIDAVIKRIEKCEPELNALWAVRRRMI
ncbi:hypothetical protein ACFO1V_09905 [Daeguia caeni]|uniref:Amidase n=1 Tax=Daeguia caeni TaxID=439612 RepID=A0ABV9H8Q9_9HYPH